MLLSLLLSLLLWLSSRRDLLLSLSLSLPLLLLLPLLLSLSLLFAVASKKRQPTNHHCHTFHHNLTKKHHHLTPKISEIPIKTPVHHKQKRSQKMTPESRIYIAGHRGLVGSAIHRELNPPRLHQHPRPAPATSSTSSTPMKSTTSSPRRSPSMSSSPQRK